MKRFRFVVKLVDKTYISYDRISLLKEFGEEDNFIVEVFTNSENSQIFNFVQETSVRNIRRGNF